MYSIETRMLARSMSVGAAAPHAQPVSLPQHGHSHSHAFHSAAPSLGGVKMKRSKTAHNQHASASKGRKFMPPPHVLAAQTLQSLKAKSPPANANINERGWPVPVKRPATVAAAGVGTSVASSGASSGTATTAAVVASTATLPPVVFTKGRTAIALQQLASRIVPPPSNVIGLHPSATIVSASMPPKMAASRTSYAALSAASAVPSGPVGPSGPASPAFTLMAPHALAAMGPFALSTPAVMALFVALVAATAAGVSAVASATNGDPLATPLYPDSADSVFANSTDPMDPIINFTATYDPASCASMEQALKDLGVDLVLLRNQLAKNQKKELRKRQLLLKKKELDQKRWDELLASLDPRNLLAKGLLSHGSAPFGEDVKMLKKRLNLSLDVQSRRLLLDIVSQKTFNPVPSLMAPMVSLSRALLSTLHTLTTPIHPSTLALVLPESLRAELSFLQKYISLCIENKTAHNLPHLFSNEYELNAGAQVSRIHVDTTTLILRSLARLIAKTCVAVVTLSVARDETVRPEAPSMQRSRTVSSGYGITYSPPASVHHGAFAHRRLVGYHEATLAGASGNASHWSRVVSAMANDVESDMRDWIRSEGPGLASVPVDASSDDAVSVGSSEEGLAPDSAVFVHAEMKPVEDEKDSDEDDKAAAALEAAWQEFRMKEEGVPEHILKLEFEALFGGGQDELDMW
ncbi:hypothetical protein HDU77_006139 [Chytriomyces hyalinus]|nr:hypothetical protein HDU77_006139 [Chytriomyces hyalinus]